VLYGIVFGFILVLIGLNSNFYEMVSMLTTMGKYLWDFKLYRIILCTKMDKKIEKYR
jgi:hypothetical protein